VTVPAELRIVAGALAYQGPVTYVILEAQRPDYIEFHRIGGGSQCKIYYKNSGKVDYTPGRVATTKTRHHSIKPGSDVAAVGFRKCKRARWLGARRPIRIKDSRASSHPYQGAAPLPGCGPVMSCLPGVALVSLA
jgi:hypothetical protein